MAQVAPLPFSLADRHIQAILDAYKDEITNPKYASMLQDVGCAPLLLKLCDRPGMAERPSKVAFVEFYRKLHILKRYKGLESVVVARAVDRSTYKQRK